MSYTTDAEIHQVVHDFETCQTGKDDFHHEQHLVVAAYYLQSLTVEAATEKMRAALFRFLDHHQVDKQKYNETVTVFWLEMVALELKKAPVSASLVEKCKLVTAGLNNGKLALDFYSGKLLWSDEARARFVEPDLRQWK
ncbi:MAG TPA: hypothetical protein VL866_03630 [Pyrinomonadaceae bacterium]|nr:hypothetical protein [Pyrinomonadaceae bacterium]